MYRMCPLLAECTGTMPDPSNARWNRRVSSAMLAKNDSFCPKALAKEA